jgi:hypothetical protein
MKKHIVVPATAEQIARNLGVTQEDREIVAKVLRELGYDRPLSDEDDDEELTPCDSDPVSSPPSYPYHTKKND